MAEIKNTFLKSKMNKDLDDRLMPNGEYRDALNISVGKSEGSDVGAIENILGNDTAGLEIPDSAGSKIIGYISDERADRVLMFMTNYEDTTGLSLKDYNIQNPSNTKKSWILSYSENDPNNTTVLVEGDFLNFSIDKPILGVNLIEDLLFFTDNRNQPRKINIQSALDINGYYSSEDNISVAKYSPYDAIKLVKTTSHKPTVASTNSNIITFDELHAGIEVGMTVIAKSGYDGGGIEGVEGYDYVTVESISDVAPFTVTTTSQSGTPSFSLETTDIVIFMISTMTNEEDNARWPGDPDLLDRKFVRFSYRFQFDDGEYSLTAPFTQIAYVPKQKGFFFEGDEHRAFRSTIVEFMSNEINNVELLVPLPSRGDSIQSDYHIKGLDILYKESDGLAIKVLETVPVSQIVSKSSDNSTFVYNYQSMKPYKNLPEFETTRVYDRVPIRALAQESAGNRVMYANFYDKHTPPTSIDYRTGVYHKDIVNDESFVEYPSHTAKQNRSYQIGFVLSDKFGRQSPVILSPVEDLPIGIYKGGSTIYHGYYEGDSQPNIKEWFGDQIQVQVNSVIHSGSEDGYPNEVTGEPGLYAIHKHNNSSTGHGFAIASSEIVEHTNGNYKLNFVLDSSFPNNANIPSVGDVIRGEHKDYVEVYYISQPNPGEYSVYCKGEPNSVYLRNTINSPDLKFSYTLNPTGWYSYKLVVKQTEQEYYNCYLPGYLDGYPTPKSGTSFPYGEEGQTAHTVLLNDNINKIPRDLGEVGPDQKQYRSSVQLFNRVQNAHDLQNTPNSYSVQYYSGRSKDTVSTIANALDLRFSEDYINTTSNFYQLNTNPLIARLSTGDNLGVTSANNSMFPALSVSETEPVVSLLDIFFESSSSGLISDLNEDVLTGFGGPIDIQNPNFSYNEDQNPSGTGTTTGASDSPYVTSFFFPLNPEGIELNNTGQLSSAYTSGSGWVQYEVLTDSGSDISNEFEIEQELDPEDQQYGAYRIKIKDISAARNFVSNSTTNTKYSFSLRFLDNNGILSNTFSFNEELINHRPYLFDSLNVPKPSQVLEPIVIDLPNASNAITNLGILDNGGAYNNNAEISNGALAEVGSSVHTYGAGVYLTTIPKKPILAMDTVFKVNHTTGELSFKRQPNSANPMLQGGFQVGSYTLSLRVKDAMANIGGSGFQDVTDSGVDSSNTETSPHLYQQKVVVKHGPLTSSLITPCQATKWNGGGNYQGNQGGFDGPGDTVYWQWAITDGGYDVNGDKPSGARPAGSIGTGTPNSSYGVKNLGSFKDTETSGTMLLDFVAEATNVSNSITSGERGIFYGWKMWYRPNPQSSWSLTWKDDNHRTAIPTGSNFTGSYRSFQLANDNTTVSGGSVNRSSAHIPMAFSIKGEYFIEAELYRDINGYNDGALWINISDPQYPTCIPYRGENKMDGTGADAEFFSFEYSDELTTQPPTNAEENCSTTTISSDKVYAKLPYSEIVTQFFSDNTLSTEATIGSGWRAYEYTHSNGSNSTYISGLSRRGVGRIRTCQQVSTTSLNEYQLFSYKSLKSFIYTPTIPEEVTGSSPAVNAWRKVFLSNSSNSGFGGAYVQHNY